MKVYKKEPMSRHTTFKVGGPCDLLINPESLEELVAVIQDLRQKETPYYIIGNGSNLLVPDQGLAGVVVELSQDLSNVEILEEEQGYRVVAEAGIKLSKLANAVYKAGLTGLEFAAGIPGTLGGAVFMNAGAYGGEMAHVVESTQFYDVLKDEICVLNQGEHDFGYRKSRFQKNGGIVLKSTLKLSKGDPEAIRAKMDDLAARRKEKQPLEYPSAGSTFKRPEGHFAGKLIEEAGLRGYQIGGAQVSEKHCGFVINRGAASAADILELIQYIKAEVWRTSHVELQEEVRILGKP